MHRPRGALRRSAAVRRRPNPATVTTHGKRHRCDQSKAPALLVLSWSARGCGGTSTGRCGEMIKAECEASTPAGKVDGLIKTRWFVMISSVRRTRLPSKEHEEIVLAVASVGASV